MKQVNFIRTLWGVNIDFTNLNSIRSVLQNFKIEGFNGIEVATGFFDYKYKSDFNKIRKELNLKLIIQIHTLGYPVPKSKPQQHLDDFKKKIEDAIQWDPDMINTHDGRDDWALADSMNYFTKVSEYEKSLKILVPIVHETHRQRIFNNHKITYDILKSCHGILINADISHWIVSAERLLNEDTDGGWKEILELLCRRTGLIHARVATPNQIQVIDPESEDNKENKKYFHDLWLKIYNECDSKSLNVTLEYGPNPYAINYPDGNYIVDIDKVIKSELRSLQNLFK
jgi:hypothetical protein